MSTHNTTTLQGGIAHFLLLLEGSRGSEFQFTAKLGEPPTSHLENNDQRWGLGVAHDNIRPENVLWDKTLSQFMLVDFKHSTSIPQMKAKPKIIKLSSLSPHLPTKFKVSASSLHTETENDPSCIRVRRRKETGHHRKLVRLTDSVTIRTWR